MKTLLFLLLALPLGAAKPTAPDLDKNLLDFSAQPFSDQGSHLVLLHKPNDGFFAFEVRSAHAFGSLAASDHPSKRLFTMRVELELPDGSRFAKGVSATAEYYPRWILQKGTDEHFKAEGGLAMPEADAVAGAVNFSFKGKAALKLKPVLVLEGGDGLSDAGNKFDAKSGVFTLTLDRSKLVQRRLKEVACFVAGEGKADQQGGLNANGFSFRLSPKEFSLLKPGQSLRFPFCFKLALNENEARNPMTRLWKEWTKPKGEALSKARARWSLSASHIPPTLEVRHRPLARRAFATLLMSLYAKRGELRADMFSQAKGSRDAFFSEGLPLIALGWSEIDFGAAEAALLEMTSFSSAAALPVPPHAGEELLAWEAGGLPLHAWAGWELFLRDPEVAHNRPATFMSGLGRHLRSEAAWWAPNRDGDGNGLYAYGREEEKPWYQKSTGTSEALQTFDIALSSFVAWEMQAAAVMAGAASAEAESAGLLAGSQKTAKALAEQRGPDGRYGPGTDGLLPYILGLDTGPQARALWEGLSKEQSLPLDQGVLHPWRAYLQLRGLSLWGYTAEASALASKILDFVGSKPVFSAYEGATGEGLGAAGDAVTAAALLEMSLGRHEQEAFLLPDTQKLEGRFLQVRTPDGALRIQRVGLPLEKAPYGILGLSSAAGPILESKAFDLWAPEGMVVHISSQWSIDVTELPGKEIFKDSRSAQVILKPKMRYRVKIGKP